MLFKRLIEVIKLQNKKSKIEQKLLKKLIKNEKFIKEILRTKDNKNIIKKFNLYGVNLKNINFDDLCKILENEINIKTPNYEVKSIDSPIIIDYPYNHTKTIFRFNDT